MKVGVVSERVHAGVVEPDVRDAVVNAIAVLGELGAEIRNVEIPLMPHSSAISSCIIGADAASLNRRDLEENLEHFDHNNQVRLLMGTVLPAQALQTALKLRQMLREQVLEVLGALTFS